MVCAIRWAGFAAAVVVCGLSMVAGCQKQHVTGPRTKVQPQVDVPATGVEPQERSVLPTTGEPLILQAKEPNLAESSVRLALTFSPGQTLTYKATSNSRKSIEWIGSESEKPADFSDGYTGNDVEMIFGQRVETVRENGNAVLAITIQALKYRGVVANRSVFEFDSADPNNREEPLMALIGKSYRLEISPVGEVVELLDVESARKAVKIGSPAYSVAMRILSDEMIRDQHEIPPLSALKGGQVHPGQNWSDLKSFSFSSMGDKSFERVYTFKQGGQGVGETAVVQMKAIPSAAMAEQIHKRRPSGLIQGLFDNMDRYEGSLEFDLKGGRLLQYTEDMQTEWVVADPAAMQDTAAQPRAIKMAARRFQRIELVE